MRFGGIYDDVVPDGSLFDSAVSEDEENNTSFNLRSSSRQFHPTISPDNNEMRHFNKDQASSGLQHISSPMKEEVELMPPKISNFEIKPHFSISGNANKSQKVFKSHKAKSLKANSVHANMNFDGELRLRANIRQNEPLHQVLPPPPEIHMPKQALELQRDCYYDYINMTRYKATGKALKSRLYRVIKKKSRLPHKNSRAVTISYLKRVYNKTYVCLPKNAEKEKIHMEMKLTRRTLYGLVSYRLALLGLKPLGFSVDCLPDKQYLVLLLKRVYPSFIGFNMEVRKTTDISAIEGLCMDIAGSIRNLVGQKGAEAYAECFNMKFDKLQIKLGYYRNVLEAFIRLHTDICAAEQIKHRVSRACAYIKKSFGGFGATINAPPEMHKLIDWVLATELTQTVTV